MAPSQFHHRLGYPPPQLLDLVHPFRFRCRWRRVSCHSQLDHTFEQQQVGTVKELKRIDGKFLRIFSAIKIDYGLMKMGITPPPRTSLLVLAVRNFI